MDTIFLALAYLVAVLAVITVNNIIERATARYFYRQLEKLFQHNQLTSYNIALLIKDSKVKQRYVTSNLRALYFKMLFESNVERASLQSILELLEEYDNELNSNLNKLPRALKEKIQLLRDKENEAIISQLVELIIDIYLSDKKYKKLSLILGIFGVFLTIIGTLPVIFNYL